MQTHFELDDREFEKQFADGSFKPRLFSHEAHLRLAWIHITNYGVDQATENIRFQLKKFVAKHGAADKYNETVTIAAIRAVYHFMIRSKAMDFHRFLAENPRLKFSFKELVNSHYCTNIFHSKRAKNEFLEPELLPFD